MIMTAIEVKQYITTSDDDAVIEAKLKAIEQAIRKYTNNKFYAKPLERIEAFIRAGVFLSDSLIPFGVGDTVVVTNSKTSEEYGLFTVKSVNDDTTFMVNELIEDMDDVNVTKVSYGFDVKMGTVNLLRWETANRDKIGIASESISRHSVTYANANGDGYILGYPAALVSFLKPYKKARF